jgi:hypothetical protein
MNEAKYLLEQLARIPDDDLPSIKWSEALPHLQRFAINPLRPHLAETPWVARMQALTRETIRTLLYSQDPLRQFLAELGEIGLEEGHPKLGDGYDYIAKEMLLLQGLKPEAHQDIASVGKTVGALTIDDGMQSQSHGTLIRATSLLHKMFAIIREETFEYDVLQVEERHGILYFVDNEASRKSSIGSFLFNALPEDMVKNSQDRYSLLMFQECRQFVVDMMVQIQNFVECGYPFDFCESCDTDVKIIDLCSEIRELDIMVKNALRPTCLTRYICTHRNNMGDQHSILRVVTRDGQAFAIDVTAAQYGWTEIMIPWNVYLNQRVSLVRETVQLGTWAILSEHIATQKDFVGAVHEARSKVSKGLNATVNEWLKKKNLTPAQLLDLPDHEYVSKEENLTAAVRDGVKETVENLRRSGRYRSYVKTTPNMGNVAGSSLTRSRREYKEQKKRWCTEKEYEKRIIVRLRGLKGRKTGLAGMIKKW